MKLLIKLQKLKKNHNKLLRKQLKDIYIYIYIYIYIHIYVYIIYIYIYIKERRQFVDELRLI